MNLIKYPKFQIFPPSSDALDWLNTQATTDIHAKVLLAKYVNHLTGYNSAIAELNYQHMIYGHIKPLTP